MDSFFVYILYSKSLGRFYTGLTTLSIEERLENHIHKKYGNLNFTQKAEDWEMFHFIQCNDFSQARKIEIHIKKMKSKIYIQNLKSYPELVSKLLTKFTSN
ncbi:GIY-YIG nuclease family protein [Cognataquiflexum rubidum]|uniref:GIY-YIG nuclease family protein n=1 Tax=Cognataquiflexum rubidum TaxID=2922273 RepID=UPI003AB936F8|nr:GIY-YIG nuclease family protein [Cognataquiflexum rubidum]